LAIDALEMGIWTRWDETLEGLVHHSDRGVQYLSIRYTEHLAAAGAVASVGSKGDSYDNAMAESINGLYKAELIYNEEQGPWRAVEDVELATLTWVHWWNTKRLLEPIGNVPPVEFEQVWAQILALRSAHSPADDPGGMNTLGKPTLKEALAEATNYPSLHKTRGGSDRNADHEHGQSRALQGPGASRSLLYPGRVDPPTPATLRRVPSGEVPSQSPSSPTRSPYNAGAQHARVAAGLAQSEDPRLLAYIRCDC
jgi:hypothetical protein